MRKIPVKHLLPLLAVGLLSARAAEDPTGLLSLAQARDFCSQLSRPTRQYFDAHLGAYAEIFHSSSGIDFADIRLLDASAAGELLDLAVANGFGIIDLVTQPVYFADGPCALFVAGEDLREINRLFDLHAVWLIETRDLRDEPIEMQYFLLGKGELRVGYPREARVAVPDFSVRGSDRFRYQPYISGSLSAEDGVAGVRDLSILNSPDDERRAFRGPYGSRIREFLISEQGDIRVEYSVPILGDGTIVLPNLVIERR